MRTGSAIATAGSQQHIHQSCATDKHNNRSFRARLSQGNSRRIKLVSEHSLAPPRNSRHALSGCTPETLAAVPVPPWKTASSRNASPRKCKKVARKLWCRDRLTASDGVGEPNALYRRPDKRTAGFARKHGRARNVELMHVHRVYVAAAWFPALNPALANGMAPRSLPPMSPTLQHAAVASWVMHVQMCRSTRVERTARAAAAT